MNRKKTLGDHPLVRAAVDSLSDEKGLRARERQYLYMVAIGFQTNTMAMIMDCGDHTPGKNLSRLYQTFGVQSRHELTGLIIKRMEEIAQWK